jgi:5-methylcytosine-specific restriction endonuclease McrA
MTNQVLLLNADFSPIRTLPLKRVVSLLSKGRIDVIESVPGKTLRSVSTTQPFPSVIRLRHFVHVPQRNATWSRRAVFSRDNYTCVYCGEKLTRETATVDHLIPQEQCRKQNIRASTWGNTACACMKCNLRKANKTMRDAGMKFFNASFTPKTPRVSYLVLSGEIPAEWRVYVKA